MHLTPLDIQQKKFQSVWRGVDAGEVESFLSQVAQELTTLVEETTTLRERARNDSRRLEEYEDREQALKETMLTAQRVTEEIVANAKKEADIIIGRAELDAEKIIESAQERLTELLSDIAELKRQRALFLQQLDGLLQSHQKLLAVAAEQEMGHKVEENLAVMKRRARASAQAVEE